MKKIMGGKLGKDLSNKTIVVFGASSNIGIKFIEKAAQKKITVIAVARNTNKISSQAKLTTYSGLEVRQGDITRNADIRNALKGRNVYATINFAVDFSSDISKARKVNVIGEQNILDASKEFNIKRHIYISTIATQMAKPSTYKNTKLEAETLVKRMGKSGLEWIILRLGHVLGTKTWDHPFKIIFPFLRLAIPQVPTDAKKSEFPYATIDTVIDAIISSIVAKPNQIITVFDGKITIGEYLHKMEKIHDVMMSFLPGKLLVTLDNLFGRYSASVRRYASAVEFLANPPKFENETMKQQLQLKTRDFHTWIKTHFSQKGMLNE